ncbi:four helix bundle protein [Candidatus Gottesmanbacteria bacterium]|nr:four helix bundle protein [Candidatus Gottesmanbacteria bacterium]
MLDVYLFVTFLPPSEKYKRVDQLERSSSSIPANIAEGYGRFYFLENISFCRNARGSLSETKNHIIAAKDLRQAPADECEKLIDKCDTLRRVLNGYIRFLKKQKAGNDES